MCMPNKMGFCFEFIDVQCWLWFIQPDIWVPLYFCLGLYKILASSIQNLKITNWHRNLSIFYTFTNHYFLPLYGHISFILPYVNFQKPVPQYLHRLELMFSLLDISYWQQLKKECSLIFIRFSFVPCFSHSFLVVHWYGRDCLLYQSF